MSNQRSFVLFVVLVIIVSYLYYESFLKKQDSLGPLNFNKSSDLENQKYEILNKRSLLYSTDDAEVHQITNKQVLEHINKNPKSKRRKRETSTKTEFLNWRFNVNITEVESGSMNSFESSLSDASKAMKSEKKNPLRMAIYISGQDGKNSNTKLQRSWGAVGEFLRNFFGSSPKQLKENHSVFIEGSNFLNQVIKSEDSSDKRKDNLTGKDKKPKFLNLLGGGNKENPPLELGSGEIDNLAFETSNISSQIVNTTNQESFTIKNLEPEEVFAPKINLNPTTGILERDLNAVIETVTEHSLDFPVTDMALETKHSTKLEVSNKDMSDIFKVDTDLPGENSSNQLRSFCLHLLKNVEKSPKFVEFAESEGSGNFRSEDSSENSELSGNQLEVTTETSSPAPQINALQNLWNRIRFRFRNGKSVNEIFTPSLPENTDLEGTQNRFFNGFFNGFGSGSRINDDAEEINLLIEKQAVEIPEEFSIQDCRNFFTIKEEKESSTQNMEFTEPTMQPEINFSSFEMNKTFLSDNLLRGIHIKDNKIPIEEGNTIESEDFKNSLETTITTVDSIIQLEEKIQEVIDSIGKGDAFETPDTTLTPIVTEQPREKLSSKLIIGTTVEETNIFETSTIFTDSFEKNLNDTDALILENANLNKISIDKFISEDYTNEESFIGNEKENINVFENTLSPLNESKQRIFNLFMSGSGSRELTDTEISTLDLSTEDEPLEMFDLGSGERKMDEFELFSNRKDGDGTTVSELSRFDSSKISTDTITEIDNLDFSTAINLRSNDVDSKTTAPHETEINGTVLRISDSEEGREIIIEAYLDQNEFSCINCSNDETPIQENCTKCEETFLNPDTIEETVTPLISKDSEIIESYLNYDNEVFSDTNINIVIPPTIPPKLNSSGSSTQQSGLAQITQMCSNCENVDTETIKAEFSQYQNIDSSHRINFNSENLSNTSTTTFEEWSPNEKNAAELPHQFDSKVSIINTTLNNFKENQFNNSRTRYARFNEEFPETPVSRRGARVHKELPDNWPDLTSELMPEKSSIQLSTSTRSTNVEAIDRNSPKVLSTISYSVSTENTDYIGTKVSDTTNDTLMAFPDLFSDFASSSEGPTDLTVYRSTTKQFRLPHNVIDVFTPDSVRSDLNTNPRAKIPVKKSCLSASECDSALNERCISKDGSATCDCGRTFKRHPDSKKCEATITLKTSLKLPGEQFHFDLTNKNSELFRRKKQQSLETMWLLLGHDPELFLTVAEIDVNKFEDGSLVVNWDIKLLTDRNETVSELTNQIDKELKEVLGNSDLLRNLPLNVQNASVSTLAVNPCAKSELNYCHKSAECILDETVGFTCKCKKGYIDNSNDKSYPGEVCIEFCYPGECGDHGECKLTLKGEKHCLCSGWYFGGKCEISGIVVIASFAGANIFVLILLLVVCVCRKRRNRSYYNRNLTRFQPAQDMCNSEIRNQRISDAVALDDIRASKMSKYANVSTPLSEQGPVIQITSPSFPGSSIDYDSTFDRSPCSSEENSVRESGTVSQV